MAKTKLFDYTAEDKAAILDQVADVLGLIQERKRPAALVKQAFKAVTEILVQPKIVQTPSGMLFHVTSGGELRTAAEAIAALDCPIKRGLANTPKKIPMILHPVDCNVRLVTLGDLLTNPEIFSRYPKIVTPAELFAFGAEFPREQLQAPIFTVWLDAAGQWFYAVLGALGPKRCVQILRSDPYYLWEDRCRVIIRGE